MQEINSKATIDKEKIYEESINIYKNYIKSYSKTIDQKKHKLLVYVITYNLHGLVPKDEEIGALFPKEGINKFDIFVINTQECLRSIAASFFSDSKKEWETSLSNFFGDNYINVINSTLGAMHISIFVKKEKAKHFHDLRRGVIKNGFMNIMSNKGAVSVSMRYRDKNILFICCHLASGQDKTTEREKDLSRIQNLLLNSVDKESSNRLHTFKRSVLSGSERLSEFNLGKDSITNNEPLRRTVVSSLSRNHLSNEDNINNNMKSNDTQQYNDEMSIISSEIETVRKDKIMEDYDFVILSGDLNYRLEKKDEKIKNIYEIMDNNNPEIIWQMDQLTNEIKEKLSLKEGIINFMPTYKYVINSNQYDTERIPGWTDRILYNSKKAYDIMLCEYSSIRDISISDHRPVYAIFKINFEEKKVNINNFHQNNQECNII